MPRGSKTRTYIQDGSDATTMDSGLSPTCIAAQIALGRRLILLVWHHVWPGPAPLEPGTRPRESLLRSYAKLSELDKAMKKKNKMNHTAHAMRGITKPQADVQSRAPAHGVWDMARGMDARNGCVSCLRHPSSVPHHAHLSRRQPIGSSDMAPDY